MSRKRKKSKRKRGVPTGYKANWKYPHGRWRERKIGPGTWKFRFKSHKYRPSKGYGGHPKGRRITWSIRARQSVVKRGPGHYSTTMYGTKKLKKSK